MASQKLEKQPPGPSSRLTDRGKPASFCRYVTAWSPVSFPYCHGMFLSETILQEESQPSEMVEGEKSVPVRYGVHSFALLEWSVIL